MTPELITARRLRVALCAALVISCAARAQVEGQGPRAVKLSEYVNQFTSCNAGAHLDYLAVELQNNTTATGHIVIYGPGGPDNSYGERAVGATKNYIVKTRGIEESRVVAVYAGRYKNVQELLTEVWLVPEGAAPPPRAKYRPDYGFEGKFGEMGWWDGPDAGGEGEGWSSRTEVTLVGLSEMMRRRADARAYLVAYHDDESAPGAWRRGAAQEAERMRGFGIPAERVKIIFGGYAREAGLQVWILPQDAPPPVRHRRERRPERSAKIAHLRDVELKYDERWAFDGLADVLKADGQLTGCLIVRLAPAKLEDADPETPPDPDDPPDVDVIQLTEKWKAELKKNGVGEHRLIIMVIPTRETQWGAEIETWVVPPGAPLPDPSADDAVAVEEEEAENPKEF